MAEVNGAHQHGRYVRIGLKSLHVMFNSKMFAVQDKWTDSKLDKQASMSDCIDPLQTAGWTNRQACLIP